MNDVKSFYKLRISELASELKALRSRFTYMYALRLVSFVVAVGLLIFYFADDSSWALWASLLSFVGFGVLIKLDLKYASRSKYLSAKLALNKAEEDVLEGNYSSRGEGSEYAVLDPYLTADFDIVGRGSIFQYINRSVTRAGERLFVSNLCRSELSGEVIAARQAAVEELSAKVDFVQDFEVYGGYFEESDAEIAYLRAWAVDEDAAFSRMAVLRVVMPLLFAACIVLILFGLLPISSVVVPFVLNLILVGINMSAITRGHAKLDRTSKIIRKYAKLIELIEAEDFSSSLLAASKARLYNGRASASDSTGRLFSLLNLLDSRQNLFSALVLNGLCGFDVQVYYLLSSWKRRHGASLEQWFATISDFDSLLGLATFAFNNRSQTVLPTVADAEFGISAVDVAHPLMSASTRVSNTIKIAKSPAIVIITGANMAGKSTFLRTLAVNLILAMNGSRVCASSFEFAPADILSSIKIQDSLSKNESYFYAEISRLKHIVDHVDTGRRSFVVLDEILRGTNNKDKQQGSIGLLQKLLRDNAIVFVATHDLVIGELEDMYPGVARNYCFEVELDENRLVFDYRLKNGVSQKLNASFLLKKMGLIN